MRKAAEVGIAAAEYDYGYILEKGVCGVRRDFKKALEYYKKAAEQGHLLAKKRLSQLSL